MSLEELLRELNIDKDYIENENGSYTIELDNSNEYSRYYTRIDKSGLFEEDEEASQITIDTSTLQFINDDFVLTLMGNFDTDEYSLIIRELDD